MRRNINFSNLEEVIAECNSLLAAGYVRHGNWSLGQVCCHLRLTIDANLHGYPKWMTILGYPLRPLLRRFVLPKLLAGNSPSGVPTAGMFVPGGDLKDEQEVEQLKECIDRFLAHNGLLHAHPGFGKMTKGKAINFHSSHAAHHISFLSAADNRPTGTVTKNLRAK